MTHKKQHSECAIPLGIKWVRFRHGVQECCGLLQEDDAVCVGSCGSAWGLETPVGTLDMAVGARSVPTALPALTVSVANTPPCWAQPQSWLQPSASGPHEHGWGWC